MLEGNSEFVYKKNCKFILAESHYSPEIYFKHENMLILGILPGPSEPSLHKMNHYLSPIVDELIELWQGIMLDSTAENKERKII